MSKRTTGRVIEVGGEENSWAYQSVHIGLGYFEKVLERTSEGRFCFGD